MQEPSNSELYEKLGRMESRFDEKLSNILDQVRKTNGRVTKLETWKNKLDVIADYRKENGDGTRPIDWQKLMMYSLGLVATALAVISVLAGKR